jgi:hypothetical protein
MKAKYKKTILILRILLGIFMLGTGLMNLIMVFKSPDFLVNGLEGELLAFMSAIVATGYLMQWISIFKIITGTLLFIPKTAPLAVLMALPFFVNILLYTIFLAPSFFVIGLAVLLINACLVYAYKEKYKPILK